MKKIFRYFGVFALILGALASCKVDELQDSANLSLGIKVFFPTKVVAGQDMTINGSNLSGVKEIVFPENVSVTDFEIVSGEMIRVTAPSGIAAEGGKIIVRTADEQAESPLALTVGKTSNVTFSKQPGESVEGGETITIYGTDLEFINAIELLDPDGVPYLLADSDFYRKGTSSIIITIPKYNIYEGVFVAKLHTVDGRQFDLPELSYKPAPKGGGHWETKKTVFWENDGSKGDVDWGNVSYRFGLDGRDGGGECDATFPQEVWDIIKDGTFRVAVEGSGQFNIRVTTGWWQGAYGGTDHDCYDLLQEEEDGTKYIELNISEDGNLYEKLDEQHLLFTGSGYTPVSIYTVEEVWVEGEEGHWEKKSIWKNDGSKGDVDWGNVSYRFGLDGRDGGGECDATFPQEVWDIIKDGTFRVAVEGSGQFNIRVTTGWWQGAYGGTDHNCYDLLQEEEDGTKYIELNISEDGNLYEKLDEQHLLFTGSGYTPVEIYVKEWVEGSANEPVIIWENDGSKGNVDWGNLSYRFGLDGRDGGGECDATFPQEVWDIIKDGTFRVAVEGSGQFNIRVTTGWWQGAYGGTDHNCYDLLQEEEDGTKYIELNISEDGNLYEKLDEQHFLLTGSDYKPLKMYYYKK